MNKIYDLHSLIKFFKTQKMNGFEDIEFLLSLNDDPDLSRADKMAIIVENLRDIGLCDLGFTQQQRTKYKQKKQINNTSSERFLAEAIFPLEYIEVKLQNAVIGYNIPLN